MRTKVQKWGNSLGLRIPRPYAEEAGLRDQSEVELSLVEGTLVVQAAKPAWTLKELLAGVTEHNLHDEELDEPPVGREAW